MDQLNTLLTNDGEMEELAREFVVSHILKQEEELSALPLVGRGPSALVHKWQYVALKVIPLGLSEELRDSMLNQMRDLYENDHPCIARFYGAEYFRKQHAIVIATEYMNRGCVLSHFRARGKIPEPALKFIAREVTRALSYLTKTRVPRVVHRGIKPSNILLNDKGEVKLTDFGLGTVLITTFAPLQTWVGTETYMSPERICGLTHTSNADVWSLGVMLVELATGEYPFFSKDDGSNAGTRASSPTSEYVDLIDRIVDGPSPSLQSPFSHHFQDFIALCCDKNKETRPCADQLESHPFFADANCDDLLTWLEGSAREIGTSNLTAVPTTTTDVAEIPVVVRGGSFQMRLSTSKSTTGVENNGPMVSKKNSVINNNSGGTGSTGSNRPLTPTECGKRNSVGGGDNNGGGGSATKTARAS